MSGGWRQHTLRVRLALWYAGAGVAVLVAVAMLALVTGVWVPNKRLDVVLVLLLGLPGAACAFAASGYFVAGRALDFYRETQQRPAHLSFDVRLAGSAWLLLEQCDCAPLARLRVGMCGDHLEPLDLELP